MRHDSNKILWFWVGKQNECSDWNAMRRQRQLAEGMPSVRFLLSIDPRKCRKYLKAMFLFLPVKPVPLFFHLYVFKLGFLDGRAGLYFCALWACHEQTKHAKFFEASTDNGAHE